jgi:hypothetical protein
MTSNRNTAAQGFWLQSHRKHMNDVQKASIALSIPLQRNNLEMDLAYICIPGTKSSITLFSGRQAESQVTKARALQLMKQSTQPARGREITSFGVRKYLTFSVEVICAYAYCLYVRVAVGNVLYTSSDRICLPMQLNKGRRSQGTNTRHDYGLVRRSYFSLSERRV